MKIRRLRWWIGALLAAAIALSYLDRQSFPVTVSAIEKEIPLAEDDLAFMNAVFLLAYGLMYAGGGRIMDWLGTRVSYAMMIVMWSAANFAIGTVHSVLGLGVCRFLLGVGEGGGFPGSGKAVAEWFPPRERSLAFGLFNAGSGLGAVVINPVTAFVIGNLGWRWVFYLTGGLGFLWAAAWLYFYQTPDQSRRITVEERDLIRNSLPPAGTVEKIPWLRLFSYRPVWGLMIAKLLTDSAWFFFIFWLPIYLNKARGFNIKQIGYYGWVPFAFAAVGAFLGGALGTQLIRRGYSIDRSRKTALFLSAALMPAALLIVPSPVSLAIVFYSLALFGHQFWSANVQTLAADLFPSRMVGSVEGLLGSAGALGAALFNALVGWLVKRHGYSIPFLIAGIVHPISFVVILLLVRRIEPLLAKEAPRAPA
jgi:ACS family hexuronate transporter-like MFS transporter